MKKVHLVEVGSVGSEAQRLALPEQVQLVMFEIAESAKEGLLALAVGAGLAVLHECMEHEVDEVVGPRGRHDRGRMMKRHGHVGGEVTLGGRRVPVSRPRVRSADDRAEIGLASYAEFARRDLLERVASVLHRRRRPGLRPARRRRGRSYRLAFVARPATKLVRRPVQGRRRSD